MLVSKQSTSLPCIQAVAELVANLRLPWDCAYLVGEWNRFRVTGIVTMSGEEAKMWDVKKRRFASPSPFSHNFDVMLHSPRHLPTQVLHMSHLLSGEHLILVF